MKKICFTFDDSLQSHYNVAKKLLRKNNLKGTFFVTSENLWDGERANSLMGKWGMAEKNFDFSLLKEFEQDGFEIGNHTLTHLNLNDLNESEIEYEMSSMNNVLEEHGIKNVSSFCYPAYNVSDKVLNVVKKLGFSRARTGYDYYDSGWSRWDLKEKPSYARKNLSYPSDSENQWLIRPKGIFNFIYRYEDFLDDFNNMEYNESAVFVFHGLKEPSLREDFEKVVSFVSKQESAISVNFRDI